jgi:hypothetical protein
LFQCRIEGQMLVAAAVAAVALVALAAVAAVALAAVGQSCSKRSSSFDQLSFCTCHRLLYLSV